MVIEYLSTEAVFKSNGCIVQLESEMNEISKYCVKHLPKEISLELFLKFISPNPSLKSIWTILKRIAN